MISGYESAVVYISIYVIMNIGAFSCLYLLKKDGKYKENIADLSGISKKNPLLAMSLLIILFSLAGIPPLGGFFAKFYVFMAVLEQEMYALAIIGLLTTVMSAFYYLKIIKTIYFDDNVISFEPVKNKVAQISIFTSCTILITFFLYPSVLNNLVGSLFSKLMKISLKKFKIVKSTNDTALKLIKKNISKPTLIMSERQTGGRGRIGKKWISKKGNLFISIFFRLNQKKINFKQFAVLNAFLIKKIISNKISRKIKIKWPNDLLYKKDKFCGILQEVIKFNKFDFLIVGIGLNTNVVPQNKSFKSTSLKNIVKKNISNQKILKSIIKAYEKFLKEVEIKSFSELKRKYK